MEGRPYLRFVYVENAIGNRPLLTTPEGNIVEDPNPLLPTGRLGQLAFVSEDDTDKYETDYIVRLATVAQDVSELGDSRSNAKPTRPIYDIASDRVYVSDRTTSGGDILFLVDVSGSMSPDIAKLKASIAGLFTKLDGDGVDDLRVGLGAYMVNHKQLMVGSSPWANYSSAAISMFSNLATNIVSGSSNAQAASAIKWGVETYKFRDDTKKFIVLVTDTGREGDPLTPPDVQSLLVSNDITLIVIAKDQNYYAPTAWATGGEFIDSSSANNWDGLLAGTLGNIITGGIIDPSVPPVWTLQRHPEDNSQYLLPAQEAGIGRLVYDEYHKTLWYVQPNGILLLIAKQQEIPEVNVNKQYITAAAAEAIGAGQLVWMNENGRVSPATKDGGKAIGFALANCNAGQQVDVQVGGVFTNYSRWILTPGTVYYQDDAGEIRWKATENDTHKHPSALAISSNAFIVLTEIYMGTGSGGGGGGDSITIEAVSVKREERQFVDSTQALTEACSFDRVMEDIFQTDDWKSSPYMLKQVLTITNTSRTAALQFNILHNGVVRATDTLPANSSMTIPAISTDWVLQCRGSYQIDLLIEVLSGKLNPTILDTDPGPDSGLDVYEYTDPVDKTKKYIVIGKIKRFTIEVDPTEDTTGNLFDFPAWIDATIASTDYMITGNILLRNVLTNDTAEVSVIDKRGTVLYRFELAPGTDTLIDLHREDIKLVTTTPGSVEATISIQVTAYKFKE